MKSSKAFPPKNNTEVVGVENPFDIDRQMFNSADDQRVEDLHLQLSEKYMVYKDLAKRCIINPSSIEKYDHRVFYIKPESVFTQEPRLQNQFRNDFIKQVSAPPVPEPFTLMADDFYRQMLDEIQDQSQPSMVRQKLNKFFERRQFLLQHKKHKYLSRWSHFALTSELVDKVSLKFSPNFSKIQFELEQAIKRHQRLDGEDHFDMDPRLQRVEPNGQKNPEDIDAAIRDQKHCSLRVDDIDIFTRIVSYETACNRLIFKFINRARWVPLAHRFDVYAQSQARIQELRERSLKKQKAWLARIEKKAQYLIEMRKLGQAGLKELQQIKSSLLVLRQEGEQRSFKEQLVRKSGYGYELPPLILWNQVEVKLELEDVCSAFKILGDMEIDDGNSFSYYTVVVQFPTIFKSQVTKNQFAPYDATPSLINPLEVGRSDYMTMLQDNIVKYGRGPQGSTLIEQLEIEQQSKNFNVQYINSLEKALFGEFNNGQDDFPPIRLQKASWLPYVCFKADISKEQAQQACLLGDELNPICLVTASMLEILNVNDVVSVNQTLESLSQIHYDKVRDGKVRSEFLHLDRADEPSIFNEQQRQFYISYMQCIKVKTDFGQNEQNHDAKELQKNSLFDSTLHLLFSLYLMTCLKARQEKTKLLYVLNAFRSIQKRLALELRELTTRDRTSQDVEIIEPGEKTQNSLFNNNPTEESMGQNKEQLKAEQKKGKIGEVLGNVENVVMDELIDIHKYRYNGLTQTQIWSTCPILPKFHITYGEPLERQEMSSEAEANRGADPRKGMSQRLLGRIDSIREHDGYHIVQDDYKVNVMYDATFADMRHLEQEMLKIVSYFINKLEPMQDKEFRNVFPTVDRLRALKQIIECEEQYHRAKLELAFAYLECFEHTCDTLEQQRIIQLIVDLMARRPRINLAANHFASSYEVEIKVIQTQTKLVREFIRMQIDNEKRQNDEVRESLEKTYRLIYEQMDNKWQYFEKQDIADETEKRKLNAVGVNSEADILKMKKLESSKPGMFQAKQPTVNINQFAEMLGMPISSLKMLLKDHNERDPLVKQSIHEHVSFIKLQEGYPIFFTETETSKHNLVTLVPGSQQIGMLEIYESLSSITKVSACIHHAVSELHELHQPDNGLVSSMQNLVALEFILAELRAVKAEQGGDQGESARDLDVIEDSSILGSSEKMLFFIKELIASAEDPNLIQNPFVLTKIDMQTIMDFNFDLLQSKKFKKKGAEKNQQTDADESPEQDESEDADDFAKKQKLHERNKDKGYPRLRQKQVRPNIPSMLEVCCSSIEVLRLRSALVEAYHQRAALKDIFEKQCFEMKKEPKIFFQDAFDFKTLMSGGENWKNFVDEGPGSETCIKTDLAVKEFDPTLAAVMNFAEPEAFKALVCPLGLEELRAVVRYELCTVQLLVVAVRHNQLLLDTSQRQLREIKMFEENYFVQAPASDILSKLDQQSGAQVDYKKLASAEESKVRARIENAGRCSFSIIAKKLKPKNTAESAFKKIRQAVFDKNFEKVEVGLRYLRTSRILLCHDYCQELTSQVYEASIRVELMNEVNQIRRRAYLLPRNVMVHELPLSKQGEHTYAAYNEQNYPRPVDDMTDFYDTQKNRISSFWRVPDFWEIYTLQNESGSIDFNTKPLFNYELDESKANSLYDPNQKTMIRAHLPQLSTLDLQGAEATIQSKGRFVDYKEAPLVSQSFLVKYLYYFRQVQNLFDLQYNRLKLNTRTKSIITLEQCVMSGLPFWEQTEDASTLYHSAESDPEDLSQPTQLAEPHSSVDRTKPEPRRQPYSLISQSNKNELIRQAVDRVARDKKLKLQLNTELSTLQEQFSQYGERMKKLHLQNDLQGSGHFLNEQVQLGWYTTLLSLQLHREQQAVKGQGQSESIQQLLELFSHIDDTKVSYRNGYHVNLATTKIDRISLDDHVHRPDHQNFFLATLPVTDEQSLSPPEFNLIRGMYTSTSPHLKSYRTMKPYLGYLPSRDFAYLDYKLLNVDAATRKYISTNIVQLQELAEQYAHARLKVDQSYYQHNWQNQIQIFQEQRIFMRHQIKAQKLKQALMILITRRMLPQDAKKLQQLFQEFQDLYQWKVISKADQIQVQKNKAQRTAAQHIQSSMHPQQRRESISTLLTQFDTITCEIDVYQNEIQKYMILTARRLIDRETKALANAFEINGKRLDVLINVQQGFAQTLDPLEDKRGHLDSLSHVGVVQKFLCKAMTRKFAPVIQEGQDPSFQIRQSDFRELLNDLCRQIIKTEGLQASSRCEPLQAQIEHLQTLLYTKDQQIYNLEHKLRHASDDLSKIVNTKVFAKSNQLIYELDHSARQLRLIKDSVFQMEDRLKESIRHQFDKDLEQARLELAEMQKKFTEYQTTLNSHMKADIKKNINEIDVVLKKIITHNSSISERPDETKPTSQLMEEYAHLLQGEAKNDYKFGRQSTVLQSKDLEGIMREMERLKRSEKDAQEDVLEMQNLIRKQRMMQNFKWLIAQAKWDAKFDNLKSQLTSNTALWEQLAESEKRERVLKQELDHANQEVEAMFKLLERLKDEVSYERMQRIKLTNFNESQIKRLNQLEEKTKNYDIVKDVDMDKLIHTVVKKDRQLEQLKSETKDVSMVLSKIYQQRAKEVNLSRMKVVKEAKVKERALVQVTGLKMELDMLRKSQLACLEYQPAQSSPPRQSQSLERPSQQQSSFHHQHSYMNQTISSALNHHHQTKSSFLRKSSYQAKLPQLPKLRQSHNQSTNIFDQLHDDACGDSASNCSHYYYRSGAAGVGKQSQSTTEVTAGQTRFDRNMFVE